MLKNTLLTFAMLSSLTLVACSGGGGASTSVVPGTSPALQSAITDVAAAPADATSPLTLESRRRKQSGTTVGGPWTPQVTDTWQWQLTGTINTSYPVNVYDIDLFDASAAAISTLKSQGKHLVCYFSAGSSENWRPDFASFKAADMGKNLSGWPGEKWLDTRSANVRAIMQARFALAKSKGCDGVEPDNVDGYTNKPGFPLTAATQIDYDTFLANAAHAVGLRVGLKNDVDQVTKLASSFDFAVNEQCNQYKECGAYSAFTGAGKPVFNAEYAAKYKSASGLASLCAASKAANIRTLVLPLDLNDKFRYSCD